MSNSLIIPFPSLPIVKNEQVTSNKERQAMYELINKMFNYKVKYYNACKANKQDEYKQYSLRNIRTYTSFITEINNTIFDPFLREFVMTTLANIRENDLNNPTVKKSYETFKNWFSLDSLNGKLFKNNLASGNSYESINFVLFFKLCNKEAITENSQIFEEVKTEYEKFKNQYEELLK